MAMATKSFALNEDPHTATVGRTELLFVPETTGPEFAEAYDALRDVQIKVKNARGAKGSSTKPGKPDDLGKDTLIELSDAMRTFITRFLLDDEQRETFAGMRLPDRVLVQMMEWVAELYGSGSGNVDGGGSSSD
jgi:hypothetical protein